MVCKGLTVPANSESDQPPHFAKWQPRWPHLDVPDQRDREVVPGRDRAITSKVALSPLAANRPSGERNMPIHRVDLDVQSSLREI